MSRLNKLLPGRASQLAALFAVGGALGATAMLAVKYVAVDKLDVVDRKRTVARVVATVDRNAPLTVVATEGDWIKVEVNGKQGYVFGQTVSDQPGGKSQGVALSKVKSGKVQELEQAAAVRGLGAGAKQYASAGGLSTTGAEEMFRRRDGITAAEFESFLAAGGLPGGRVAAEPATTNDALAAAPKQAE